MAKKRRAIKLDQLGRESAAKVESMAMELAGEVRLGANDPKPALWSRRFAASGKGIAPKIRQS